MAELTKFEGYDESAQYDGFLFLKSTEDGNRAILRDGVMVELYWMGEGYEGDYDPEDPEDDKLLRFDVSHYRDGEMAEVSDSSYCCQVTDDAPEVEKLCALRHIWDCVADSVKNGVSVKRDCEQLSRLTGEQAKQHYA